jgi:NADH:ubiquinone oxidoreductase subunit E
MLVNDDVHVNLTEESVRAILKDYRRKAASSSRVKSA